MADVDFATCQQPDELIQLAWNAGHDRTKVIREGTDAARYLLAGERNDFVNLFWPVPRRLEAVRLWSGNHSRLADIEVESRPFASAVIPACIAGGLTAHFLAISGTLAIVGMIAAMFVVLGLVLRVLIGATIKRWVAQLDDDAALAIVLDALRAGMKRTPARIPRACERIRDGLQRPGVAA
ncbi:MAG: hypothetical protein IT370_24720 [Deltaproteobacteria bacterium]|nr:hypothetical protein [Deltaproteobacteria bacterium]